MKDVLIDSKQFGVHEECGIFGVISPEKEPLAREVYYGLFALQHRGQESAGIAVNVPGRKIAYYKNMGLVNEVFSDEELELLPDSDIAIGHVRYSTCGSSNVVNAQPVVFYGRYGRMAIAHNGNVVNAAAIKNWLIERGHIFQSSVDSEVVAALINYYTTSSVENGVQKACLDFLGAFAIVCMADNKLIAVRDKFGLKPLVMGRKGDSVIFASESCALDAVDAEFVRDVEPGEMIIVTPDGKVRSHKYAIPDTKPCIFEYVYLARSDSVIDGVSVYEARYNCGKELARLFKIDADIVAGVPDSATVCARGYADVSGLPMVDALTKNRYIGRTFIQPSQSMRELRQDKTQRFPQQHQGEKAHPHRRQHSARHHLPQDNQPAPRKRRERGAYAGGIPSRQIPLLLRRGYGDEGSAHRRIQVRRGDMQGDRRGQSALYPPRPHGEELRRRTLLHRLFRRQLSHGHQRKGDPLRRRRLGVNRP